MSGLNLMPGLGLILFVMRFAAGNICCSHKTNIRHNGGNVISCSTVGATWKALVQWVKTVWPKAGWGQPSKNEADYMASTSAP